MTTLKDNGRFFMILNNESSFFKTYLFKLTLLFLLALFSLVNETILTLSKSLHKNGVVFQFTFIHKFILIKINLMID